MAIEITPQKGREEANFSREKFFKTGIIFITLLVLVSLLFHFFKWRFSQAILEIDDLIRNQRTEEMISLEKEIQGYHKKTKNLSSVIEAKKSSLSSLKIMEKSIHPLVFFFDFKVDVSKNTVNALGIARNIVAFDQQLRIFREEESIVNIDVPNFEIKEDRKIEFPINIVFK